MAKYSLAHLQHNPKVYVDSLTLLHITYTLLHVKRIKNNQRNKRLPQFSKRWQQLYRTRQDLLNFIFLEGRRKEDQNDNRTDLDCLT